MFYFSPGDQEYPVYHQPDIRRYCRTGSGGRHPRQPLRNQTAENAPKDWFLR